MSLRVACLLALQLAGCFVLDRPAGLQVLCGADSDCPSGLVCSRPTADAAGCCVTPETVASFAEANPTTLVCRSWCADPRLTPDAAGGCAPSFSALAAADDSSCGLVRSESGEPGALYCWGAAAANVTRWYHRPGPHPRFSRIEAKGGILCGLDALDASLQCFNLAYAEGTGLLGDDARKAPFTDLSMADDHVCGLTTAGAAVCLPTKPEAVVPAPLPAPPAWKSLAAGTGSDCGLDELGNIACWPARPPELLAAVADRLARSSTAGCSLIAGTLQCWAESEAGKTLVQAVQPESGATFASVAVGGELVCALPQDPARPPACWASAATATPEETGFGSLTVGRAHACALRANGSAFCWGANDAGQAPGSFPPAP
jgi:hypothetical protein